MGWGEGARRKPPLPWILGGSSFQNYDNLSEVREGKSLTILGPFPPSYKLPGGLIAHENVDAEGSLSSL